MFQVKIILEGHPTPIDTIMYDFFVYLILKKTTNTNQITKKCSKPPGSLSCFTQ
jgi:hypothetical protein